MGCLQSCYLCSKSTDEERKVLLRKNRVYSAGNTSRHRYNESTTTSSLSDSGSRGTVSSKEPQQSIVPTAPKPTGGEQSVNTRVVSSTNEARHQGYKRGLNIERESHTAETPQTKTKVAFEMSIRSPNSRTVPGGTSTAHSIAREVGGPQQTTISVENSRYVDSTCVIPKEEYVEKYIATRNQVREVNKPQKTQTSAGKFWNINLNNCDLDEHFAAARKEAVMHANKRNECFKKSREAYLGGRGAEAKEFSELGKEHKAKMEAANKKAMEIVIVAQDLDEADKINLHGLYVQEAVEATRDFVKSCIGRFERVQVITGQGLHSDKGPVIKPAIIKLCEREDWEYSLDFNPGCLLVRVPNF